MAPRYELFGLTLEQGTIGVVPTPDGYVCKAGSLVVCSPLQDLVDMLQLAMRGLLQTEGAFDVTLSPPSQADPLEYGNACCSKQWLSPSRGWLGRSPSCCPAVGSWRRRKHPRQDIGDDHG